MKIKLFLLPFLLFSTINAEKPEAFSKKDTQYFVSFAIRKGASVNESHCCPTSNSSSYSLCKLSDGVSYYCGKENPDYFKLIKSFYRNLTPLENVCEHSSYGEKSNLGLTAIVKPQNAEFGGHQQNKWMFFYDSENNTLLKEERFPLEKGEYYFYGKKTESISEIHECNNKMCEWYDYSVIVTVTEFYPLEIEIKNHQLT